MNQMKIYFNFVFLCIIILFFKRVCTVCIQGEEYFSNTKEQCIACKKCHPPYIVIASCQIYSNTKCGLPSFSSTSSVSTPILHLKPQKAIPNTIVAVHRNGSHDPKLNAYSKKDFSSREIDKRNCTEKKKFSSFHHKRKSGEEFATQGTNSTNTTEQVSLPIDATPVNESELTLTPEHYGREMDENKNVLNSILGSFAFKVTILIISLMINVTLVVILIVKIISHCCRRDHEGRKNPHYDLPDPSLKPIKCQFTAVLPNKPGVEYANIDSSQHALLHAANSGSSSGGLAAGTTFHSSLPQIGDQIPRGEPYVPGGVEYPEYPLPSVIRTYQTTSGYSRQEDSPNENFQTATTYNTLPNPLVMDDLLEHRRAFGCNAVENNLYTETWHHSPVQSRHSQQAASRFPTFYSLQRPVNPRLPSPLMVRTYRATPEVSHSPLDDQNAF